MSPTLEEARRDANLTRYRPGQREGHYESFFLRANHPDEPQAFWIRYTIFSPRRQPERTIGELWSVYFDATGGEYVAAKNEWPLAQCAFSRSEFSVRCGDARLGPDRLEGSASSGDHTIDWDLRCHGEQPPLFMFPLGLYRAPFPKAKTLVGLPMATFDGFLSVDGRAVDVVDWVGSQNHNWGSRHTDHYAWGQVAGFDSHPNSFLEIATARVKIGPLWTPFMSPVLLRHNGDEIALNGLRQTLRARGRFNYFTWNVDSEDEDFRVQTNIRAPRESFVGLAYANPPGGTKHCLNSKIGSCELKLTNKHTGDVQTLTTEHRAAFEIVTDDRNHGVTIQA